jgi:transposase
MPASSQISPEYVADLEQRLARAEAANAALTEANARLERLLFQSRHARFGSSSEKGDPDQRNLFAEDIEIAEGQLAAAGEAADKALGKASRHASSKGAS